MFTRFKAAAELNITDMLFMAFVSFIGFLLPGSSLQQGEKSDTRARMEREKSLLNTTSSNLEYV